MTAVLKAGARDGLTAEKIISTYQNFQAILKVEESTFTAAMQRAMDDQVAARQKAIEAEASKVKNLEAEITDSRERQSKLSAELITAQTNIQRKQAQFKAALDARATDITAAIQHYTSILQGGN
jgi:Skp family chaperone for outer membrane proteins